jgi:serine/threonine-protein kinase HipA
VIDHLFTYLERPASDPRPVGEIFFTAKGGKLVSSTFHYDTGYLGWDGAFAIDPALDLHVGAQYATGLPGAVQGCAPDRWGRNLINEGAARRRIGRGPQSRDPH